MRALPLPLLLPLLLLLPCLVGWNGSGPAVIDIQGSAHATPDTFRSEAVCSGHPDRLEVIIVIELPGDGDAVLSLRIPRALHNRDLQLPYPDVRARYHEYGGDGEVRFAGERLVSGFLRAAGNPRGALDLDFELTFGAGDAQRMIVGDSRLVAVDWDPVSGTNRGGQIDDPAPEGYYEGGCYGTYYESDSNYDSYGEDDYGDSGSGCGDDDLDDDGPSGSSGGCDSSADDDGYDDYGDDSDAGGCAGDDTDSSDDSWDEDDSGGCEGDNVDALVAGCARGGPGGPWIGRLVRWLPWLCVFLAIRLMRRRQPLSQPA